MSHCKTAILFFSQTASREAMVKKWKKGDQQQNYQLARSLIQQAEKTLQQAPFPVFHFSEIEQTGASFGERLSNAYRQIFGKGYQAVIAVGNDSPEIQQLNWQKIAGELEKGRSVLGPSMRGGAYLIGLHRAHFDAAAFQQLPWQTANLYDGLKRYAERCAAVAELPPLRDINTFADVKLILKSTQLPAPLRQLLLTLIKGQQLPFEFHPFISLRLYVSSCLLRGPPSFVSAS